VALFYAPIASHLFALQHLANTQHFLICTPSFSN